MERPPKAAGTVFVSGLLATPASTFDCSPRFPSNGLTTTVELRAGDQAHFVLRWGAGGHSRDVDAPAVLRATLDASRRWMGNLAYEGPEQAVVRRSVRITALTQPWEAELTIIGITKTVGMEVTEAPAATTAAITERLGVGGGLLYRYLPEEPPTVCPAMRERSCCAASGWWTTWPAGSPWTR